MYMRAECWQFMVVSLLPGLFLPWRILDCWVCDLTRKTEQTQGAQRSEERRSVVRLVGLRPGLRPVGVSDPEGGGYAPQGGSVVEHKAVTGQHSFDRAHDEVSR